MGYFFWIHDFITQIISDLIFIICLTKNKLSCNIQKTNLNTMITTKNPFPEWITIKKDILIDKIQFLTGDILTLLELKEGGALYRRKSDKESIILSLSKVIEILGFNIGARINEYTLTYEGNIVGDIAFNAKIKSLEIGLSLIINLNSFEVIATSNPVECIKVTDNGKLIVATASSTYLIELNTE